MHERAKRNFFAMQCMVRGSDRRKPVVHRVRGSQSCRLKAQPGEQRSRLRHAFETRACATCTTFIQSSLAIGEHGIAAEPGEVDRSECGSSAPHVGPPGRRRCAALIPCAHGIADACRKKTRRTLGDHLRIDEDEIGRPPVDLVGFHAATLRSGVGIDHREGTGGRIGRADGRTRHERQAERRGGRPGGVEHLASAGGHDRPGTEAPRLLHDRRDLTPARLTAKEPHAMGDADLIESGGPDGRQPGDGRRTGDDKRRSLEADGDHFGT